MVSLLDLDSGNIRSLGNALNYLGINFKIVKTSKEITKSKILIIPGVGSFDHAMGGIEKNSLKKSIIDFANVQKKPLLGICIGMQILFERSKEGKKEGLGILNGNIEMLKSSNQFKVPHVGFSPIKIFKKKGIFKNIENDLSFYFTNSFCLKYKKKIKFDNYCYTKHSQNFYGLIHKKNIFGIQFHPELSHTSGLIILKNFIQMNT